MPKHVVNLLLLLGGFLFLAYVAKVYLTDPSFYKYGHYRADAVPEIAAGIPLYKGAAYCQTCHDERLADWATGSHRSVQCELCHGPDLEHPDKEMTRVPTDTIRLCTNCHEELPARPAWQPQIVLSEHPFPDEETEQCHTCHDPHSPGNGEADEATPDTQIQAVRTAANSASAPASTKKCAKCHGKQGEGRKKNPPLAGLESVVFIRRMNGYISGAIEHKKMAKYATALSDEEIVELAEYYANLPAISPQ